MASTNFNNAPYVYSFQSTALQPLGTAKDPAQTAGLECSQIQHRVSLQPELGQNYLTFKPCNSHGHSNQSMAPEPAGQIGDSVNIGSQRVPSPSSFDMAQSLYRESILPTPLPPSPAISATGIDLLSIKEDQTMEIATPAGRGPLAYQTSGVTAFTGKHPRPTTPETTPPSSPYESTPQELVDLRLVKSSRLVFGGHQLQKNHERSNKMHGMDEIRRVVRNHLSINNSYYGVEQHLEDGPNRKKQKRYHEPSAPPDQFPQSGGEIRTHRAIFNVHWQVKEFVEGQFGDVRAVSLGSVIAVTGSARDAQATTVTEYLMQTWPDTALGLKLLESIQEILNEGGEISRDNGPILKMCYGNPIIVVHVDGVEESIIQIAQQLAWLGSALRTSESGSVGRSEAQISAWTNNLPAIFEIEFATDVLEEKSCWHDLFFNPVIAFNFPISSRDHGLIGLEIPIQMMAALGGASHAVEFKGGLMLKGFSCMFVPLQRHGNSIQWHFITNEDNTRLEYLQADQQCPKRALLGSVDQESLASTRAFLGWWGKVTTNLGTTDAKYENINWSPTKEASRPRTTPVLSIRLLNIIEVGVSFAMGPKDSKLHVSRTGHYEKLLQHASKVSVVLYDTRDKRGWLVPSSAVIAHIAKTRHFRKPFSIAGKPVDIISADPARNVCDAAEKMLLENRSTKLFDGDAGSSSLYFEQMVRDIWGSLEDLLGKGTEREFTSDSLMSKGQRLLGWEFMDLVEERSPLHLKETIIKNSCGGWINFAQEIDAIVLFASGFEDVIEPAEGSTNGLCHRWKYVPKDKDYLAAGIPILKTLYERAGSLVTKENQTYQHRQRHHGQMLFENCLSNANSSCNCDRLQQVESKQRMGSGSVVFLGPLKSQGAVIFGKSESSFLLGRSRTRSMRKGNKQNNLPEPHTNFPSLPSVESPLRCGRSPLKPRKPEPIPRQAVEADKEDVKDRSKAIHGMEQEVPDRLSKEFHEGSENMYPRTSEARRPFPLRVQEQKQDVQQSPNGYKSGMATRF